MTHIRPRSDPWLLLACAIGVLTLVIGMRALFALIDQSVESIFAGLVR